MAEPSAHLTAPGPVRFVRFSDSLRPYRLAARTAASQAVNRGSIPRKGAIYKSVAVGEVVTRCAL